ncbi:YbaN family protein [Cochlodiniinecator piscidefendens]|uniref:YbaN family protein n=1 Tax=Cochlodiniinecator piscidefendens TaxID=2715756 RepID=UPI00140E43E2|nr:YbaN family protein [Cochlodiniinecator piscidefendens]
MKYIWLICGLISLGLGLIGAVLPLLPTVPLLLLATFFFAKSSETLHSWLINHPTFGPSIEDWNQSGAIRPKAKKMATASVAVAFVISAIVGVPNTVLIIQAVVLSAVLTFIWSRPSA